MTYAEYLNKVGTNNLGYAAQKFNLSIAEAGIEMAKVLPDPSIFIGGFDNGQARMKTGYAFSANAAIMIELGGKRKARVNLATSQTELTKALLNDFFRNLRADATISYLSAIKLKYSFDVLLNSYTSMKKLAIADSIRYKLGSIMEIDAKQSNLEASMMLNNIYQSEANWKGALVQLSSMMSKLKTDTLYFASGDFSNFDRTFDVGQLIVTAQNNRTDLLAALKNQIVSRDALALVKANRMIDLSLIFGVNSNAYILNKIEPTPSYNNIAGGLSIPIKFSNNYKGDLKAAEYSIQQADVLYKQVELQVQTEVISAYYYYTSLKKQARQFNTGLLLEAKRVLEGKIYSYQRGETSLLEVLIAQRTYNEVQLNYYETLYSYASALVQLERAVGIWDINM